MKALQNFLLLVLFISIFSTSALGAKVDTVVVSSEVMQKDIKAAVVLPASYNNLEKASYPVLYLLHGGSGSYRDWLSKTPDKTLLHRLADQYNLIIVTPDAGAVSYYFDSPIDMTSQYETFISKELIEKIDDTYRTISDRKGRVIAGLSMGGHGAFYIATQHPDLYSAAGSMSGVMNINTATWKVPAEFAQSRAQNFAKLLGPPSDASNPYPEYTAVGRADILKSSGLKLIFDVGIDDFLIDTNRDLHRRLLENGTPHTYIERPGAHSWEYWENALPYQVLFLTDVLKENGSTVR